MELSELTYRKSRFNRREKCFAVQHASTRKILINSHEIDVLQLSLTSVDRIKKNKTPIHLYSIVKMKWYRSPQKVCTFFFAVLVACARCNFIVVRSSVFVRLSHSCFLSHLFIYKLITIKPHSANAHCTQTECEFNKLIVNFVRFLCKSNWEMKQRCRAIDRLCPCSNVFRVYGYVRCSCCFGNSITFSFICDWPLICFVVSRDHCSISTDWNDFFSRIYFHFHPDYAFHMSKITCFSFIYSISSHFARMLFEILLFILICFCVESKRHSFSSTWVNQPQFELRFTNE